MQKKAVIGISVAAILVVAIVPVAFGMVQRAAITGLKFHFDRLELTDVDFTDTKTSRSIQQVFGILEKPSDTSLTQLVSLHNDISSISSPEGFVLDTVANTKLTFSMFVNVQNPSSFEAIIDRAQIRASINNRELPSVISISQQTRIPAGGDTTIELSGITLSGKEVANMLVNLASNDFVLTLDFGITSYFPTLFGEIPIPAKLNLDIYLIPPKPSFDANGSGFQQVAYTSNSYELTFTNSNPIPLTGKFQVGVLKGNSLLGVDVCDPSCWPIDNGFIDFVRINLGSINGIQVFEKDGVSIKPGESFKLNIDNPELRDKENSAFIIRWNPDYERIPYVMHSEVAGIESTSQGEFSSHSLIVVKKIAYNLVRDFGYVGSKEFVSPDKSTFLSFTSSALSTGAGSSIDFSGRLTDLAGNGISGEQIYLQDEDTLSRDEYLGSTYTDSDGRYSYTWTAKSTDFFDSTVEVFASYKGSSSYGESRSNTVAIKIGSNEAPTHSTHITIDTSAYSAYEGDTVIFSGSLTDENGQSLADKVIYIEDEDTGSTDEYLGSAFTDTNGKYTIYWNAKDTDFFDSTIEVFASYKGSTTYSSARSGTLNIDILKSEPTEPERESTSLSLQATSDSSYEGDRIAFAGRLTTQNGDGVPNALVYLKDEDAGSGDDEIGTVTTGSDGTFTFYWDARPMDPFDNVVEVYAVYEGSSYYLDSRSDQIDITVYEQQSPQPQFQTTSLTLMASSINPNEGDLVEFSGNLVTESGDGVAGALIYIKDEDTGSGDDLMGTITTDSNGHYSFEWNAKSMDPFDNVVEVYAVFEGSSSYDSSRSIQINVQIS